MQWLSPTKGSWNENAIQTTLQKDKRNEMSVLSAQSSRSSLSMEIPMSV